MFVAFRLYNASVATELTSFFVDSALVKFVNSTHGQIDLSILYVTTLRVDATPH